MPSSPAAPSGPFDRLPLGDSCVQVRPGLVSPQRRGAASEASSATNFAWVDGVAAWYEVRFANAWRAEVELSGSFDEFAEKTNAIIVPGPWDGACEETCGRVHLWRLGPRRAGVGVYNWPEQAHGARCGEMRRGRVEQGQQTVRREVQEHYIEADEHQLIVSRQVPSDLDLTTRAGLPHIHVETREGRPWLVRYIHFADLDLEEQDRRFRNEAYLESRQRTRPLPVARVRVMDTPHATEQLRLWGVEAQRRTAAVESLLDLITRLSVAQPSNVGLLKQAAALAFAVGHPEGVLPWLDEYLEQAPNEADERVHVLRRWAVSAAAPERLAGLLREEDVTRNAEEAAQMLMSTHPYDVAESVWVADETLREPRLRRVRRGGSLPLSTLVETLVGLLDLPGTGTPAVFARVDSVERFDPFVAQSLTLVARWHLGVGSRALLMSPHFAEVSDTAPRIQSFTGEATVTVSLGDDSGANGGALSVQGHVDGDVFVIERASQRYDWAAVATFVGEPLIGLSRRLFPPPSYRFSASAEAQETLMERSRADEGIACAAGRDGGDVFECAVPAERIIARRSMVDLVRPLLR